MRLTNQPPGDFPVDSPSASGTNPAVRVFFVVLLLAAILGLGWWVIKLDSTTPSGSPQTGPQQQSKAQTEPNQALDPVMIPVVNQALLQEIRAKLDSVSELLAASGSLAQAVAILDGVDRQLEADASARAYRELRQAIDSDRAQLQRSRTIDLRSTASMLNQMVNEVDRMPLISTPKPLGAKQPAAAPKASPSQSAPDSRTFWQQVTDGLTQRVLDAVQIRRVENPEAVFLTAEQGALVAERLKLRLLSARMALVARQPDLLQQDLLGAQAIIKQTYDLSDPLVIKHLAQIKQMIDDSGRFAVPSIQRSLDALGRLSQKAS